MQYTVKHSLPTVSSSNSTLVMLHVHSTATNMAALDTHVATVQTSWTSTLDCCAQELFNYLGL